ncbi:MAG: flagellar assembly protein FliW [Fervidobacterium sp.]|uniref:flagellar assembly protein FliW n=1 Tax=Fervidobacterium sp. TaxID=1871331 RepID=UPI004049BC2F
MAVYKTRLGEFDINDDEIITFPSGIPGFENLRKFFILSLQETAPISWLVSIEDEQVSFPIIDPWIVKEDYEIELSQQEVAELEVEDPSELIIWCIVTIPLGKPQEATVNLKAPIVVNVKKAKGIQAILENYDMRYPLMDATKSDEEKKEE